MGGLEIGFGEDGKKIEIYFFVYIDWDIDNDVSFSFIIHVIYYKNLSIYFKRFPFP